MILHDVIYTPTGHVTVRAAPLAGALSAAQAYNAALYPRALPSWRPFRVYPTGTYTPAKGVV